MISYLSTTEKKEKLSYLLLICCLLLLTSAPVHAFTMSNGNWIIQMGNLNSAAGKPSNSNFKLGVTVGETGRGLYSGTNYTVRAGFQYIKSIIRFRFAISSQLIDFGTLTPTNPVKRTNTLTVSNGSAHGYTVTAFEDHQLLIPASGSVIPDTTCDTGLCTESTAASWPDSSILVYGFGYRCDNLSGTDCATFPANNYKQFADNSKAETPQNVMSSLLVGKNRQTQITYKVNISGTQAAGRYSNVITYIATPTY
jgi:hypothetical protein